MNRPAFLSFVALVGIQVTIGLVYSSAVHKGQYLFSQASALTIAETLKFLISSGLYLFEDTNSDAYKILPSNSNEHGIEGNLEGEKTKSRKSVLSLLHEVNREVPHNMKAGFAVLACLYGINNHLSFLLFLLADSGTISLIKSGSTFTTALVLVLATGQNQAGRQWFAILLQVFGLVITQTDFTSFFKSRSAADTLYPFSTYGLLFLSAVITAVSSVANERLCKSTNNLQKISLNAQNMFLYSAGALINLSIYILKAQSSAGFEEPAFWAGYNNLSAIMVVISNTVIGLAITAVYKYANAVIKCLAMAFATGILLLLAFLLFNAPVTVTTLPGSLLIFLGTYLYVTYGKTSSQVSTKELSEEENTTTKPQNSRSVVPILAIFSCAYGLTLLMVYYFSWWGLQVRLQQVVDTSEVVPST